MEGNENFTLTIDQSSLPRMITVDDPGQTTTVTVIIVDDDSE